MEERNLRKTRTGKVISNKMDKTIFIVSQRTSSIQFADQIIVMDDGHAVGIGTHEQLLENCEIYREIYESQFKKEDLQKQKGGAF